MSSGTKFTIVLAFVLVCLVMGRPADPTLAANNVWTCPSALQALSASGNLSAVTLFTPSSKGWYDLKIAVSPAASTVAATAGPSVTFSSDGVSRTITMASLSLANINVMNAPAIFSLYLDQQPVTISLLATGTYNLRACWRPSSV